MGAVPIHTEFIREQFADIKKRRIYIKCLLRRWRRNNYYENCRRVPFPSAQELIYVCVYARELRADGPLSDASSRPWYYPHTHTLSPCPVITPNAAKLANSSTGRIADLLETKEFLCPLICQVCAHESKKGTFTCERRACRKSHIYVSDPHRSSIATNIFISQEFSDGWKKKYVAR